MSCQRHESTCESNSHTISKFIQWYITADCITGYNKAGQPILQILWMAGCFLNRSSQNNLYNFVYALCWKVC